MALQITIAMYTIEFGVLVYQERREKKISKRSVDHTYDRQSHSSDRVHDHFYRHTYNSKVTTTYD